MRASHWILGIGVVATFGAIMAFLAQKTLGGSRSAQDLSHLKTVYGAWVMYAQDWNGGVPPNLWAARSRVPSNGEFLVSGDPFTDTPGPFPVDATRFENRGADARVSFAYRGAGGGEWIGTLSDPKAGVIANPFAGRVRASAPFAFERSGKVWRITVAGVAVQGSADGVSPSALFGP